jgi:NAD(P)-dependent dehydrogenase (short-subunit alcohol dehydrogenase family)
MPIVKRGKELQHPAHKVPPPSTPPMLAAGFAERPDAFAALHGAHPTGRIGTPEEVAHLIAEASAFLNGSSLCLNGGIAGRLHHLV